MKKNVTRRKFIIGASAGAVAIGVAAAVPTLITANDQSKNKAALNGPVMAYVIDTTKGDVILLNGTHRVTVRDTDLVKRLVNAAQ